MAFSATEHLKYMHEYKNMQADNESQRFHTQSRAWSYFDIIDEIYQPYRNGTDYNLPSTESVKFHWNPYFWHVVHGFVPVQPRTLKVGKWLGHDFLVDQYDLFAHIPRGCIAGVGAWSPRVYHC